MSAGTPGTDLLQIDEQLSDEERLFRDTVRSFVADRALPHIADWFEEGTLPRDIMPELGKLGVLGMHLTGYGCAGAGAIAYGVACRELEACDSGLRSAASVQGSLSMFPIWRYGSEEQKTEWLPKMAAGEAVGCFGLTEPDHGSDPGSMRTFARRDGSDWVLSGTKMWITNGSIADIAVVWARTEEGIRGFLVPRGTAGFTARDIHKKLSLRASITSELHLDEVRLPADAVLPGVTGLKGPLSCLTEARFGIAWGVTGAARTCLESAIEYATDPRAVRQAHRLVPADPGQARLDGDGPVPLPAARAAPRPAQGSGLDHPGPGQHRQDDERADRHRHRQAGPDRAGGQRGDARVPPDQAREQPGGRADLRGNRGNPHAGHRPGTHRHRRVPLAADRDRAGKSVRFVSRRRHRRPLRGVSSMAEQWAFNPLVQGSTPWRPTR